MSEKKIHFALYNHNGSKVSLKRAILLFTIAAIITLIFGTTVYILIAANTN